MKGYGDILRINLANNEARREAVPLALAKKMIGGMGINDFLLWEHFSQVDPLIDPISMDNVLIIGMGPLGATGIGSGSKLKITYKSPVTGFFGDSVCGGTFGSQMRWAGIDYIVITGKAKHPVYLYIENQKVEIRRADHLWGLGTSGTIDALYESGIPEQAGILCIGQAGENGIRYSCIVSTHNRVAGRTGAGCVAGSKNLKAIVSIGSKGITVHDPEAVMNITEKIYTAIDKGSYIDYFKKNGTLGMVDKYNNINGNAYRNNQRNYIPKKRLKKISANWYNNNLKQFDIACSAGCTYACSSSWKLKNSLKLKSGTNSNKTGQSPEYITIAAFGMECDVQDYDSIIHFNELCNDYGLDYEELGGIIPFIIELSERNILTQEKLSELLDEPVSLEWRSAEAIEKIIHSIVFQKNKLGKICSYNTKKLSEELSKITGTDTTPYAPSGKGGMSLPEEVRPFPIWAIMVAVNSRGCDPMKGFNTIDKANRTDIAEKWFGKPAAGEMFQPSMKGKAVALSENYTSAINCLGICMFRPAFDIIGLPLEFFAEALTAITGMPVTAHDLLIAGERAYNMEKAFNSRIGLRRQDDCLCQRFMEEPIKSGPGESMKVSEYFETLLDEYYEFRGWDKQTSLQKRDKLEELGLSDIADDLKL